MIKYWGNLLKTDNTIIARVYNIAYTDVIRGKRNWLSNIKTMLQEFGFGYIWDNPHLLDNAFLAAFKQRVIDCFIQKWFGDKQSSAVLGLYDNLKVSFEFEKYLDNIPANLRFHFTRLRLSAHSLRIQTGRYNTEGTPRNERYCQYCDSNNLEDEHHFIVKCPLYANVRSKYLNRYIYTRPSMYKFVEFLKSKNMKEIEKLCIFIREALKVRQGYTFLPN